MHVFQQLLPPSVADAGEEHGDRDADEFIAASSLCSAIVLLEAWNGSLERKSGTDVGELQKHTPHLFIVGLHIRHRRKRRRTPCKLEQPWFKELPATTSSLQGSLDNQLSTMFSGRRQESRHRGPQPGLRKLICKYTSDRLASSSVSSVIGGSKLKNPDELHAVHREIFVDETQETP